MYGGPEQYFCPAKVYEYDDAGHLVINAQNCVHCKCCSIKVRFGELSWGKGTLRVVFGEQARSQHV